MDNDMKKSVTIGSKKEETTEMVEDRAFTAEETVNQLLLNEEDFLHGLVEAASFKDDQEQTANIEIIRPDSKTREKKMLFQFRVRALTEKEYTKCRNLATKYVRNRNWGVKMPKDTDSSLYRASIIYEATIEEDREKLWDNKAAWKALRDNGKDILRGLDVIENCLKAGEKDRIIDVIDRLSGYSDNLEEIAEDLEDTIKN